MTKSFRAWDVEPCWLLPPSVLELVPAAHPAHFVRELVRTELDLSAIYATYTEERGDPPYHPRGGLTRPRPRPHTARSPGVTGTDS